MRCNLFYFRVMNPAEAYILSQKEPFRSMLLQVQLLIETTVPGVTMAYKWRLPFFYVGKSPICYLNVTKGYLDIGFWTAKLYTKHQELLISEDRKQVRSLRYRSPEDIDSEVLVEVLEQAYHFRRDGFLSN